MNFVFDVVIRINYKILSLTYKVLTTTQPFTST